VEWNATYERISEDVLEELSLHFIAILSFRDVSLSSIVRYGAVCKNLVNLCGTGISTELLLTIDTDYKIRGMHKSIFTINCIHNLY